LYSRQRQRSGEERNSRFRRFRLRVLTGGGLTFNHLTAQEVSMESRPYPWPFDGDLRPANTALIIIDMQTDFCGVGGYVDRMGYDLSLTRAPIAPIASVLAAMRRGGFH